MMDGETKDAVDAQPQEAKRPYVAPTLRHLGSVRELTFGRSIGTGETLSKKRNH